MSSLFTQRYVFKILSGLWIFIHIAVYYSECEYTTFNLSSTVDDKLGSFHYRVLGNSATKSFLMNVFLLEQMYKLQMGIPLYGTDLSREL